MLLEILKLPAENSKDLSAVAALLCLVDQPLQQSASWEDVGLQEVSELTIAPDEKVVEFFSNAANASNVYGTIIQNANYRSLNDFAEIKQELESAIKRLPFKKIIDPETGHRQAFSEVLRKIVEAFKGEANIQNSRIMVFALLLLALGLDKGDIAANRLMLVHEFSHCLEIEDDVFDDLLKHAAVMHTALKNTSTIIFE